MKRMLRTGVLALLAVVLLLTALPATAAPSADGWKVSSLTEWIGDWLLQTGIVWQGSASTVDGEPTDTSTTDSVDPSTQTDTNTTEPIDDGGDTEAHPLVDPYG